MNELTHHGIVQAGSWVEVSEVVLSASERAAQVPKDTRQLPLQMRVKGFLQDAAVLGDEVVIKTLSGRHLRGKLSQLNPAYDHTFGTPIPELSLIGTELRALLSRQGRR